MYNVTVGGKRVMTPKEELEALRSQYISLRSTHSEMHPDVISLKKKVEAMESEVSTRKTLRELYRQLQDKENELALLSKKYSGNHPDVIKLKKEVAGLREEVKNLSEKQTVLRADNEKPENPSYINLQTQITSTQMEIDRAQNDLTRLNNKYDDYQKRVESTPQVELEYRALLRDYANAQAKYQETMNRLLAAREAKGLEESRMAEKLTIVDPPVMPEKPDRPNRLALLLVGMVLSLGSGVGFGSMAEYMDRSVGSPDELAQITGHPVLAVIPYLEIPGDLLKRRRRRWALAGGSIGLVATGLIAVHFLYRPLDILWLKIVRRLYFNF
jgi:capsular polysaccharide biosynthesis protein